MDYELLSRMYYAGAKFGYIDKSLSYFREGGVSSLSFKKTLTEHRNIALRNGSSLLKVNMYLGCLRIKRMLKIFFRKLHVEELLRQSIKKQQLVDIDVEVEKNEAYD